MPKIVLPSIAFGLSKKVLLLIKKLFRYANSLQLVVPMTLAPIIFGHRIHQAKTFLIDIKLGSQRQSLFLSNIAKTKLFAEVKLII